MKLFFLYQQPVFVEPVSHWFFNILFQTTVIFLDQYNSGEKVAQWTSLRHRHCLNLPLYAITSFPELKAPLRFPNMFTQNFKHQDFSVEVYIGFYVTT